MYNSVVCSTFIVKCSWDGRTVPVSGRSGAQSFCQPFCSLWISTVLGEWGGLYQRFNKADFNVIINVKSNKDYLVYQCDTTEFQVECSVVMSPLPADWSKVMGSTSNWWHFPLSDIGNTVKDGTYLLHLLWWNSCFFFLAILRAQSEDVLHHMSKLHHDVISWKHTTHNHNSASGNRKTNLKCWAWQTY